MFLCFVMLVVSAGIIGWGLGLSWLWSRYTKKPEPFTTLGDHGLAGLLSLAGLGIILHFFVPLSPGVAISVLGTGAILLALLGRPLFRSTHQLESLFFLLCAAAVCLQAQLDSLPYDVGLYYVPTILWNAQMPIIPGLANIHGRFGYNNTGFVLGALVRVPVLLWKTSLLVNALFTLFVMSAVFQRIRSALCVSAFERASNIYGVALLTGFCASTFLFHRGMATISTDFIQLILTSYAGMLLLLSGEQKDVAFAAWAAMLAALALTVKLSALPLFLGTSAVLLIRWRTCRASMRHLAFTLAVVTALISLWTIRGLLLSGCVVYPSSGTCVSALPWTVPAKLASNESRYILDYARGTIDDPHTLRDWLEPLVRGVRGNRHVLFLGGLCVLAATLWAATLLRDSESLRGSWSLSAPAILIGLGWITFAVFKGPAFRFYNGGAFILAYTVFAVAAAGFAAAYRPAVRISWIPAALCFILLGQVAMLGQEHIRTPATEWPRFDHPDVSQRTTRSGLSISVISNDEKCWDTPLPCTPYFDPGLQRIPWLNRFYYHGRNTLAYRNFFPARPETEVATDGRD